MRRTARRRGPPLRPRRLGGQRLTNPSRRRRGEVIDEGRAACSLGEDPASCAAEDPPTLHTGKQFVQLEVGHAEVEGSRETLQVDAVARRHHPPSVTHARGRRWSCHSPVTPAPVQSAKSAPSPRDAPGQPVVAIDEETRREQVGTIGQSLLQRLEEADPTLSAADQEHRRRLEPFGPAIHDLRADPDLHRAADLQENLGLGRVHGDSRDCCRPATGLGLACHPGSALRRQCRGDRARRARPARRRDRAAGRTRRRRPGGTDGAGTAGGEGGGSVPTRARQVVPRTCGSPSAPSPHARPTRWRRASRCRLSPSVRTSRYGEPREEARPVPRRRLTDHERSRPGPLAVQASDRLMIRGPIPLAVGVGSESVEQSTRCRTGSRDDQRLRSGVAWLSPGSRRGCPRSRAALRSPMSLARMVATSRGSPSRVVAHADSSDSKVRVARAAHGGRPANRSKRLGRHGNDVNVVKWCQAADRPRSRFRSSWSGTIVRNRRRSSRTGGQPPLLRGDGPRQR